MNSVELTIAVGPYDHARDLLEGLVQADGIRLTPLHLPIEETFYRFMKFREWHVSEISFGKYVALCAGDDCPFVALPVFPSRVFRQSSLYVRSDSPLSAPAQLRGRRVGVPEWAQTAAIYTRGWLSAGVGIPLNEIEWTQAGVLEAGREEKVALQLPAGLRLTRRSDKSLRELLLAGELDAVMSARPPLREGDAIRRLFTDYEPQERDYYAKTRIFPIMHVIALRRDVYERHPWTAMNLLRAFEESKARSLDRLRDLTASHYPLPWMPTYLQRIQELFGDDPWPYGIEANRPTLEAFTTYAWEQGVTRRRLAPEELFPPEVRSRHRV